MFVDHAPLRQQFVYELDCIDMTFDRKGDLKNADGFKLRWMKVYKDPTAM